MRTNAVCFIQLVAAVSAAVAATSGGISPSTYTAPGAFPSSLYSSYYNSPTATSAQPQPVVSDPVIVSVFSKFVSPTIHYPSPKHKVYPLSLTDPNNIPVNDTADPHPLPPKASPSRLYRESYAQIISIAANPIFGNNTCARCQAGLEAAKFLALAAPEQGPVLAVALCQHFNFSKSCDKIYSETVSGSVITQVVANADVGGLDGQVCLDSNIPSIATYSFGEIATLL
jgi:sphingomyelin phosphodiesterase